MVDKEGGGGFMPAEYSEHRWHVDSEHGDEAYGTIVSGKGALAAAGITRRRTETNASTSA